MKYTKKFKKGGKSPKEIMEEARRNQAIERAAIAKDIANTQAREAVQAARGSFGSYRSPQISVAMPTRTAQVAPVPQITPQTNLANHFKTRGEAFNYARKQGWKTFTYDDGKGKYKQFTTEVAVPASGTAKQQEQQGQQGQQGQSTNKNKQFIYLGNRGEPLLNRKFTYSIPNLPILTNDLNLYRSFEGYIPGPNAETDISNQKIENEIPNLKVDSTKDVSSIPIVNSENSAASTSEPKQYLTIGNHPSFFNKKLITSNRFLNQGLVSPSIFFKQGGTITKHQWGGIAEIADRIGNYARNRQPIVTTDTVAAPNKYGIPMVLTQKTYPTNLFRKNIKQTTEFSRGSGDGDSYGQGHYPVSTTYTGYYNPNDSSLIKQRVGNPEQVSRMNERMRQAGRTTLSGGYYQQGGVIEEHNQRGVQSKWPAVGNFINNNKNNISQALKTAGALAYPMVGGYFAGRKLNDKLRNRTVTQYTGLETNDGPPLPQARDPFYVVPFHNRNEFYDRRDVYTPHPEKGLEWKNDKLTENIFAGATREEKDSIYNAEKVRFANEQRNRAVRRQQGGAIEDLRINDEMKLEALFRYFQAKGVPQEALIDPETGSFNVDYEPDATKFFQTVGEDTEFWSAYKSAPDKTIAEYIATENPESVEMAKKGAKLKKLQKYKKGNPIKKCSCGCDMITSREEGGKLVSKCACGCKN